VNYLHQNAFWITKETIIWDTDFKQNNSIYLVSSKKADLKRVNSTIKGNYVSIPLTIDTAAINLTVCNKFPHLNDKPKFKIPEKYIDQIPDFLKNQNRVVRFDATENIKDISGLQIPGALDDLYTHNSPLGITWKKDTPELRLWAPTAQDVKLYLYDDPETEHPVSVYPMNYEKQTGIWHISGRQSWKNMFYLYGITVYMPCKENIFTNMVTDPYSVSLAQNSRKSQIADLHSKKLYPKDWNKLKSPELHNLQDISIYELHIRDFSSWDLSIPYHLRGKYGAFSIFNSNGMKHLKKLSKAGLTHVHLLPVFDIATIDENPENQLVPDYEYLKTLPPDSPIQQEEVIKISRYTPYNWGYDPLHYNTPEGSYAIENNNENRILEFRNMVQSLHKIGLRVIMDVVYNHTHSHGCTKNSVLDKCVPGYYHRLNSKGDIETSTCCANTATEHNMMRKLMIDSVMHWATEYHIDGFRFDLMGHHMLDDMKQLRSALNSLTPEKHGIDGSLIYVYGEGWDFGEVSENARGINACQKNIGGSGIGAFNDRIRDAVRGDSPFGDHQNQGFVTGLYTAPNGITPGNDKEQKARLLYVSDLIRASIAGSLVNYNFLTHSNKEHGGNDLEYMGQHSTYCKSPNENVVYASAHDNETLFDCIQYKAPQTADINERIKMQALAISIVALSQGIPFFHAGVEMLRSKSFDRNSYNSGDWFNHMDFSYKTTNYGLGLPPEENNRHMWEIQKPLLRDKAMYPQKKHIQNIVRHFTLMLQIRYSTPLFRLQNPESVNQCLEFLNTGPNQIPGIIAFSVRPSPEIKNAEYKKIIVIINSSPGSSEFTIEENAPLEFSLHPFLYKSPLYDMSAAIAEKNKNSVTFHTPGRCAAVFVDRVDYKKHL